MFPEKKYEAIVAISSTIDALAFAQGAAQLTDPLYRVYNALPMIPWVRKNALAAPGLKRRNHWFGMRKGTRST